MALARISGFFPGRTLLAVTAGLALAACGTAINPEDAGEAGRSTDHLLLTVINAESRADGRRCMLGISARNATGHAALNVQIAWMARTEGFGSISDYQMLGDFADGETRVMRIAVHGSPCDAVRDLKLSRAVCVVGPATDPPQSCAEQVMLDGGGVIEIRSE